MNILFFDIASHDGLLACVREKGVLMKREIPHRIRDRELTTLTQELLKEAKWEYKDITHLACVIGPGGFVSLRIAAAFANALCWSLNIPVTGIHLSNLYSVRKTCHPELVEGHVWLHSTKKTELFAHGGPWKELTHITLDDLNSLNSQLHYIGELLPEHQTLLDDLGITPAPLQKTIKILPAFLSGLSYKKQQLKPWYGREG